MLKVNVTLEIEGQVNTLFLCHITKHATVFVIVIKRSRSILIDMMKNGNVIPPLFVAHLALVYNLMGNLMPSMAIIDEPRRRDNAI